MNELYDVNKKIFDKSQCLQCQLPNGIGGFTLFIFHYYDVENMVPLYFPNLLRLPATLKIGVLSMWHMYHTV
jgi:hypothetical protein